MCRVILICVLSALLAPSLAARDNTVWWEDAWLADSGLNPCTVRRSPCDIFLRRIYNRIIDARQRGDTDALDEARRQLYWYYRSNPERRPVDDSRR